MGQSEWWSVCSDSNLKKNDDFVFFFSLHISIGKMHLMMMIEQHSRLIRKYFLVWISVFYEITNHNHVQWSVETAANQLNWYPSSSSNGFFSLSLSFSFLLFILRSIVAYQKYYFFFSKTRKSVSATFINVSMNRKVRLICYSFQECERANIYPKMLFTFMTLIGL